MDVEYEEEMAVCSSLHPHYHADEMYGDCLWMTIYPCWIAVRKEYFRFASFLDLNIFKYSIYCNQCSSAVTLDNLINIIENI